MEQIEERLPGMEEYICKILAKEKLSKYAEQRRLYYTECIEVQKLPNAKPPSLPPRNDGFAAPRPGKISTSSSSSSSSYYEVRVPEPSPQTQNRVHPVRKACEPREPTYQEYDHIKDESEPEGEAMSPGENFYEIPICQDGQKDGSETAGKYETFIDTELFDLGDDSDTSYETVDGDADDTKKVKTKKNKAKRISIESHDSAGSGAQVSQSSVTKSIHNFSISGELHCKIKSKWTKIRLCGVSGNRLIGYQKDKDVRPVVDLVLTGYDVTYLDRDGKRGHVIRISCPGCESHFLSFDGKDKAETWLQHLSIACQPEDVRNLTLTSDSGVSCDKSPGCSSSESGHSGDGVTKPIAGPQPTNSPNLRGDDAARNRKGLGAHLTEFLGTFGKKRGKKTMKMAVDISDLSAATDTDVDVSGYLNVYICDRDRECTQRWCRVRDSYLEVYPVVDGHVDQEGLCEWSLLLAGCDIAPVDKPDSLAFKISDGKDRVICEAHTVLEQGDWVRVLVRETRCAENLNQEQDGMEYCYIEEEVEHSYQHRKSSGDGSGQDYDAVEYDDVYMTSPFLGGETSFSLELEDFLSEAQKRLSLATDTKHAKDNHKATRNGTSNNNDAKERSPKSAAVSVQRSESYSPTSRGSCGVPRAPVRNRVIPRTPIVQRTEQQSRSESSSPVLQRANTTHATNSLSPKRNSDRELSPGKERFVRSTRSASADDVPNKGVNGNRGEEEGDEERPQIPGVVPCSQGRTIDQDRELLQSITDNPFLSQLRNKKISPHEKVRIEIGRLRKTSDDLKDKRALIRRRRSQVESFLDQRKLDAEYRHIDLEYKRVDNEIATLEKTLLTSPINIVTNMSQAEDDGAAGGDANANSPRSGRNSVLARLKQFEAMSR